MNESHQKKRAAALQLLLHYFELFRNGRHGPFNSDLAAETEDLLDYIIDAAAEKAVERVAQQSMQRAAAQVR